MKPDPETLRTDPAAWDAFVFTEAIPDKLSSARLLAAARGHACTCLPAQHHTHSACKSSTLDDAADSSDSLLIRAVFKPALSHR